MPGVAGLPSQPTGKRNSSHIAAATSALSSTIKKVQEALVSNANADPANIMIEGLVALGAHYGDDATYAWDRVGQLILKTNQNTKTHTYSTGHVSEIFNAIQFIEDEIVPTDNKIKKLYAAWSAALELPSIGELRKKHESKYVQVSHSSNTFGGGGGVKTTLKKGMLNVNQFFEHLIGCITSTEMAAIVGSGVITSAVAFFATLGILAKLAIAAAVTGTVAAVSIGTAGIAAGVVGGLFMAAALAMLITCMIEKYKEPMSSSKSNSSTGGGRKKKQQAAKAAKYEKTGRTHVGRDGVKRVVYVKGGKTYVKKKSAKTGAFTYRNVAAAH